MPYKEFTGFIQTFNFVTKMNDLAVRCVMLNVCDLKQKEWSIWKVCGYVLLKKERFLIDPA